MDAVDIIYQLRRKGFSQAKLARDLGVSSGVINNVIHDRVTAHGVATSIAALMGCAVTEVWPERYKFKPRGAAPNRRGPADSEHGGVP